RTHFDVRFGFWIGPTRPEHNAAMVAESVNKYVSTGRIGRSPNRTKASVGVPQVFDRCHRNAADCLWRSGSHLAEHAGHVLLACNARQDDGEQFISEVTELSMNC